MTTQRLLLPGRSLHHAAQQPLFRCLYQSSRERLHAYRNARPFATTSGLAHAQTGAFIPHDRRQAKGVNAPKLAQAQELARGGQVPTDVGMVPQTFVMPTGPNRPSWLSDTRQRLSMEWYRWRALGYNLYLSAHYKWFVRTAQQAKAHGKITLDWPLRSRRLATIAQQLHADMYAGFAAGDAAALKGFCADGVLADLLARISRRARGETLEWTCQHIVPPRVVSHRSTLLPFKSPDGTTAAIRQAVVRMVTRQSLKRTSSSVTKAVKPMKTTFTTLQRGVNGQLQRRGGNVVEEQAAEQMVASEEQDQVMTEYFVIQRRLWNGVEEPWMVWGMTEETTEKSLHEMKAQMNAMRAGRRQQAVESLKGIASAKT